MYLSWTRHHHDAAGYGGASGVPDRRHPPDPVRYVYVAILSQPARSPRTSIADGHGQDRPRPCRSDVSTGQSTESGSGYGGGDKPDRAHAWPTDGSRRSP